MGIDINVCIEYQFQANNDSEVIWVNGDYWQVNPYYTGAEGDEELPYNLIPCFDTRDSDLFSLLSGIKKNNDIPNLGFNRGIPQDASPETQRYYLYFKESSIAPSWATLAELKAAKNAYPTIKHYGYASLEEHQQYNAKGIFPKSLSKHVSNPQDYVYMEIESPNYSLSDLIESIEQRKEKLVFFPKNEEAYISDHKIRIVFFYDY